MLPLHTRGRINGVLRSDIVKVLPLAEALAGAFPLERVIVRVQDGEPVDLQALARVGFGGVWLGSEPADKPPLPAIYGVEDSAVIGDGDVVRVRSDRGPWNVLYRRGANANTLLVTERCNSLCLMCSQPPRPEDDSWRVQELHETIRLIDPSLPVLGITGGEPTLLGAALADLFNDVQAHLPETQIHVLSNGRNFADRAMADLYESHRDRVTWGVPLYADVATVHDYVVQAKGAFEETIEGLYNLAASGHRLEIRFVVHRQTAPRLREFATYVYRNLPFVQHVALMGLEAMGYARMNRVLLWLDPVDYAEALADAADYLETRGVPVSIYNHQLCVLPRRVWHLARQSISDWKNAFDAVCENCGERDRCGGFFASAGSGWKSRGIKPI